MFIDYSGIYFYFSEDVEKSGNTPIKGPFSKISIGTLITLLCIFVASIFLLSACLIVAIHRVQEGHAGLYYKNGALLDEITEPGNFSEISIIIPKCQVI